MPNWKKRIFGFFCYQFAAFTALLWPVQTDQAMFETLREQFLSDK